MRIKIGALLSGTILLAACTSGPIDSAGSGGGLGSRVGALIGLGSSGATTRSERSASLVSAGFKPLAGANIKTEMDRNEAELRAKLDGTDGVAVTRVGDQIIISMQSDAAFSGNKDELKRGFQGTLDKIAAVLKAYDRTLIDVFGYTDSNGSEQGNSDLSQRRALAIANVLARKGIHEQRFAVTGFGETRSIASNDTAEGRAKNRRMEIQLTPLT